MPAASKSTRRSFAPTLPRGNSLSSGQLCAAVVKNMVVGFSSVRYRQWDSGLIGWLDSLAVTEAFHRKGIGTALVKSCIAATRTRASLLGFPALGLLSTTSPSSLSLIRLHKRLAGQIRDDLHYSTPADRYERTSLLVWHPLLADYFHVPTGSLARQAWRFGGFPEDEFRRRYGQPDDVDPTAPAGSLERYR